MEKPSWAFSNKTFFNIINNDVNTKMFIFSDFEHNWDLFQFLTNDNKYYFCLNKNICSKYNFEVIYKTYYQKCKHIDKENICFILFYEEQEVFFKQLCLDVSYLFDKQFLSIFNLEETLIKHFNTYLLDDALKIINNNNKLCICETNLTNELCKNIIKRSFYDTNIETNIIFFGASVTAQQYSYVDYLIKNCKTLTIDKKGYSGCHINQAIWLVDDCINKNNNKYTICFIEWITSVLKLPKNELKVFLTIIIEKLLKNNITPIFLYLYKTDIIHYLDTINIYEEIAEYYNISSIHLYNVIQNIKNIDTSLILKDTCHTTYDGSNFYGLTLQKSIFQYLLNSNISPPQEIQKKTFLTSLIDETMYTKYKNIKTYSLNQFIDCNHYENIIFNEKIYYKINKDLIINIGNKEILLIAINILYYKNNGFIHINDNKIQTWDKNCYYKRNGYIDLKIHINETINIFISQENFSTSSCKYESTFPDEKYLWLSELIYV